MRQLAGHRLTNNAEPTQAKSYEKKLVDNLAIKNRENERLRDIHIPECADPERRARCEADTLLWLKTYLGHKFTNPFTEQQRAMVVDIESSIVGGFRQAVAAPRGEGKTSIVEGVMLKVTMTGLLHFALVVAAGGRQAEIILENMKLELSDNELLIADYPEICVPLSQVSGSPRRCALQTHNGKKTKTKWAKDYIILPTVTGSKSSGAIFMARGIDSGFRGLRIRNRRPEFVLLDDPETRESAGSDLQIETREKTIDKDIAGLVGPNQKMGIVMLCTLQNTRCIAAKYTDPKQKPAWNGKRFAAIVRHPDNAVLWEEYAMLRKEAQEKGDKEGLPATEMYLAREAEMNAGAIVGNPYNYRSDEASALQHYQNIIADIGLDNFQSEYQNAPREENESESEQLTELRIISKQWTGEQYLMPSDTAYVTAQIDMGKYACHWEVNAWLANDAGFTIDYGIVEVKGTEVNGAKEQTDVAIGRALAEFHDLMRSERYFTDQGEHKQVNLVMVDSGEFTDPIYRFCATTAGFFVASKGYGDTYSHKPHAEKILGNHYYIGPVVYDNHKRINLVHLDSNHWKQVAHDAWLIPTLNEDGSYRKDSMCLYHTPEKSRHHSLAKHKTAEEFRETFIPGKGLKRAWFKVRSNNHWGDTGYMGYAARELVKAKLQAARRRAASPVISQGESMFPSLQGVSYNPAGYG